MPDPESADGGDEADDSPDRDRPTAGGADDDGDSGIRFTLPPIKLPPLTVPEGLRVVLPPPRRERGIALTGRRVLAGALLLDLLDAAVALWVADPVLTWGRIVAGVGLAALLAGVYATLYAWEAVAVAMGVGPATVVPSLALVVLLASRR